LNLGYNFLKHGMFSFHLACAWRTIPCFFLLGYFLFNIAL